MEEIEQDLMVRNNKLKQLKSLSLESKIALSKKRIREWHEMNDGKVYISFSGGKDSTVLLHLVRNLFPDVPAVFVNTGLEYPEVVRHVHSIKDITIVRPAMSYKDVINTYGYPMITKRVAALIE